MSTLDNERCDITITMEEALNYLLMLSNMLKHPTDIFTLYHDALDNYYRNSRYQDLKQNYFTLEFDNLHQSLTLTLSEHDTVVTLRPEVCVHFETRFKTIRVTVDMPD